MGLCHLHKECSDNQEAAFGATNETDSRMREELDGLEVPLFVLSDLNIVDDR
jgi:hypothetical protein